MKSCETFRKQGTADNRDRWCLLFVLFPPVWLCIFASPLPSLSLLLSSAHHFTHPPTPCIDRTEIEEVLGVSHWLPPSVLRPESWQPYYMTASSSSQVHYPVPLTLLVMLWM